MNRSASPDEQIQLDPTCDNALEVTYGVMAVRLDDDHDAVLTPGDSVTIRAGVRARAWNAGDSVVRFVLKAMRPLRLAA
jgi:mannose-6-phosphate isomerase-like protein (cupin superfamily)